MTTVTIMTERVIHLTKEAIDGESYESEDRETPQKGSLRETLAAAKGIRKYISPVEDAEYFIVLIHRFRKMP